MPIDSSDLTRRQQAYEEACRRAEALAAEAKAAKERERKQAVPLDVQAGLSGQSSEAPTLGPFSAASEAAPPWVAQAGNWLAGLVKPKVTPPEEPAAAATDFRASFKQAAA
eukprot:CAMPEP_0185485926 /NCGR_PEP_ID=MMETSP1366-20130426/10444_1 /TAXON_ID=38817 /ORGANISM="Gephyrocapsa oceanica, Strain RCC1303" /LENGTH=110 /DNA_ID=CAMNT_0028094109 /DNA_START=159 /DNA_END=489 /DNA_ORIENTATION=+